MTTPLISIITITYNAEKELPRTIASILEQNFDDFEHLVIDGASSDRTLEIARRNPDARIISERDRGLYDAMNKGLKNARGKYVLFLNAGDTFRNSEILSRYAAEAKKGYDIIYSDTMVVDADGKDLQPRHYSVPDLLTFESFSRGMLICHQAFMVKKEIAPTYDLQYRFSADYDWTIRCIKNTEPNKCINLKVVGINYLSDGMTDKNKFKSLKERYHVMASHYGTVAAIKRHIQLILGKR